MRKLKVNWDELSQTGKDIEDNILEFEKNRILFENEIDNVSNYWTGDDAVVYQSKALEYLGKLKLDVDYLYDWARYFDKSSKVYNGVEEDGLQRIRNSVDLLSQEASGMNQNISGGGY